MPTDLKTNAQHMQLYDPNSRKYWDDLFKDTDYYDQYKSIWTKYETETPWTFWGWLTGQNATNQYKHDMSRQDELVALHQKMYDENYMSYENQAQEMRYAGMNPDLSGVSANAGAAGAMNRAGIPDGQAANPLGIVGSIASSLMSIVGMASEIYGVYERSLDVDAQKIDNAQKMDIYASAYVLDNLPSRSSIGDEIYDSTAVNLIESSPAFAQKYYGMSRRQARQFGDAVTRKINSPSHLSNYYGLMSKSAKDRKSYISDTSGSMYDDEDEVMRILFGELINAQNDMQKSEAKSRKNKADYDASYYDGLDSSYASSAQNELNKTTSAVALDQRAMNSFLFSVRQQLSKSFKDGNTMSGVVLAILNAFTNNISSFIGLLK